MIRRLRSLLRAREGLATIEFALTSSLFLLTTLTALDGGLFLIQRSQLSNALDGAGLAAFTQRSAVNFTGLPAFVRQAARMSGATVTVGCNGGSSNCTNDRARACACLSKTGTFANATCGTSCTGNVTTGSTAGYYMRITATAPYVPMVLPASAFGTSKTHNQQITVRLQ